MAGLSLQWGRHQGWVCDPWILPCALCCLCGSPPTLGLQFCSFSRSGQLLRWGLLPLPVLSGQGHPLSPGEIWLGLGLQTPCGVASLRLWLQLQDPKPGQAWWGVCLV